MKILAALIFGLSLFLAAQPVQAGPRVNVFIGSGGYGCAPAPIVRSFACAPRSAIVYSRPTVIVRSAPVFVRPAPVFIRPAPVFVRSSPVFFAPSYRCAQPVSRAPIVSTGIRVSANRFAWRH